MRYGMEGFFEMLNGYMPNLHYNVEGVGMRVCHY